VRAYIALFFSLAIFSSRAHSEVPVPPLVSHDIEASLSPSEHGIVAVDRMKGVPWSDTLAFFLNRSLTVESVLVEGKAVPFEEVLEYDPGEHFEGFVGTRERGYGTAKLVRLDGSRGKEGSELEVRYSGMVNDSLEVPEFSRARIADETTGLIEERGTFLSDESFWYPSFQGVMLRAKLSVTAPKGYESVSQGKRLSREERGAAIHTVWEWESPSDAIFLVLGKWEETSLMHGNTEVSTFFFPESKDLVEGYLAATARYLGMYEEMIGPYPYTKFAVVENFFPTGYGMPSFTLLGSSVIRLPFIVHTSLGHEVLHNWWGNGVFVDYETGNWCEGLTTYLADHLYKEKKSKEAGAAYRKDLLRDYSVYVREEADEAVRAFTARTTPASRAIGYGKVAMIFHQMKLALGDQRFMEFLRLFYEKFLFRKAAWEDITGVINEVSGSDMGWFFRQWVDGKGAPTLRLEEVKSTKRRTGYLVSFRLRQEADPGVFFKIRVPALIETEADAVMDTFELSGAHADLTMESPAKPLRLLVDQNYDCMRRLDPMEIEPSVSMVLGDKRAVIVLPSAVPDSARSKYQEIAALLKGKEEEVSIVPDEEVTESDTRTSSLFLLGRPDENSLAREYMRHLPEGFSIEKESFRLAGKEVDEPASLLVVVRNPANSMRGVAFFCGTAPQELRACAGRILHYGNYGYLSFRTGEIGEKGTMRLERNPMVHTF
jgi:hypothetical protein